MAAPATTTSTAGAANRAARKEQKGGNPMKATLHYLRYALTALTSIGFATTN